MPKPIIHGRDHAPGGADPIPGGGIQFDVTPQTGDWLSVETTGIIPGTTHDGMQLYSHGDIEIQNTTVDNTGNIFIAGDSGVGISGAGDEGVTIDASGLGDLLLRAISGGAQITIQVNHGAGNQLRIVGLPTSNPGGAGGNFVWRDASGFLRIG